MSPATVAAAYRTLGRRGLVRANRRQGTVVAAQPPLRVQVIRPVPPNAHDLSSGNPDPALLPPLGPALAAVEPRHRLYGGPAKDARLVELARADFGRDGIDGYIAIMGGALDGIERVLQTELRPGDGVVLEDPGWPRIADLVASLGLRAAPVTVDAHGPVPDGLARALQSGARAAILTPRGQNPTGAAVDASRARELRAVLERHPDALVIEDDYVAAVGGAPYVSLHAHSPRWAVIRSLSKVLGPDLRIAPLTGDPLTVSRVEGRQLLGPGWVSHLLQQATANLWADPSTATLLDRAAQTYAERRAALVEALATRGITVEGSSGLGAWIPLAEEAATVQALMARGFAVSAGERYRFRTPPGIRVTTSALEPREAERLATALGEILSGTPATYAG